MRLPLVLILLSTCAAAIGAQTIERPWPARGDYREARLYAIEPGGGFVLVVQQVSGVLERFTLTETERATLRAAVDAGMSATGRPSAESASDLVSEPAGNAFARHQTALAATIYAPLAASLADDGSVAGATYLLVTGGTFFASYAATQSMPFTRAQSALAADSFAEPRPWVGTAQVEAVGDNRPALRHRNHFAGCRHSRVSGAPHDRSFELLMWVDCRQRRPCGGRNFMYG